MAFARRLRHIYWWCRYMPVSGPASDALATRERASVFLVAGTAAAGLLVSLLLPWFSASLASVTALDLSRPVGLALGAGALAVAAWAFVAADRLPAALLARPRQLLLGTGAATLAVIIYWSV